VKVAIVKYNAGNVHSVENALKRIGIEPFLTDKAEELQQAERVIFPGVGEASSAMSYLQAKGLDKAIKNLQQPVLGVCLGMQLLGDFSEENETVCLGIVPFRVRKFKSTAEKVPHMGWNQISSLKSELFEGVAENSFVYFVHSYFVESNVTAIAHTNYVENFSSAIKHENFYAVQFHPEKSGEVGARILENFLKL
jgi:glutamine amidotransferase